MIDTRLHPTAASVLLCCLLGAPLLVARPASALEGPATQPSPITKSAATERLQKGLKLFDQAEVKHDETLYEAAYVEFFMAYSLVPSEKVLWNIALCELRLKHYADALKHFREYDRRGKVLENEKHPRHQHLKEFLAEASRVTAHVQVDASPGAHVFVDGKDVGAAPLADVVDVMPGAHTFEAEGHRSDVTVAANETSLVKLLPPPEPPPVQAVASAPPVTPAPPPPEPAPYWTTQKKIAVVTFGGGLVALGAAAILGAKSSSDADKADAISQTPAGRNSCALGSSSPCDELNSLRDSQDRAHTMSLVFGTVGAAASVVGVALFFIPLSKETGQPRTTAVSPWISPTTNGVSVQGAF